MCSLDGADAGDLEMSHSATPPPKNDLTAGHALGGRLATTRTLQPWNLRRCSGVSGRARTSAEARVGVGENATCESTLSGGGGATGGETRGQSLPQPLSGKDRVPFQV